MLVSYNLLNKYVPLKKIDPFKLADLLTNAGLEVEEVRPLAQGSNLVIGQIVEVKQHPESDKLSICQVDVKKEVLQIVCGANNVAEKQKVIVAQPGCQLDFAKVPVIKEIPLAGVKSQGMICSLTELGVPQQYLSQAQLAGIEVLDDTYEVGAEALQALQLNDYIIDIALTPNRSDIYSVYALAIEVAALLNTKMKEVPMTITNKSNSSYKIKIKDAACQAYGLFTMDNLNVKESPLKIKSELWASGLASQNNVVDYANLAMLISGNPIHVFDADKLKSKEFTITKGKSMPTFVGLDNRKYRITKDDLVILNGDEIVAIAGVIGSLSTRIDNDTKNIVIESASFDHVSIRNTAKRLDLYTEASIRFSKIINPYTLEFPIALLSSFLKQDIKTSVEKNYPKFQPKTIGVKKERIGSVLGIDIDLKKAQTILEKLQFSVTSKDNVLKVKPPSYRHDIELDVDVIEEIIRMEGYDSIKATLPRQEIIYEPLSNLKIMKDQTRHILKGLNLNEIITYQLASKAILDPFSDEKVYQKLANPLSEEHAYYRDQLLSSMVETLKYNKAYQHHDLSLFEISNVARKNKKEDTHLSLGMVGLYQNNSWLMQTTKSDFYLLKGIIFNLLDQLGYTYGRYIIKPVEANHFYMHPTRSAYLMMGGETIGIFGELHPKLAKQHKLPSTYVGTINLSALAQNVPQSNQYKILNRLPVVTRDLSLVAAKKIKAADIIKVIKTGNNKIIKDIRIFDVYEGEKIGADQYSISIKLTLQDPKVTLTDDVVNETIAKITNNLANKLDISLRS